MAEIASDTPYPLYSPPDYTTLVLLYPVGSYKLRSQTTADTLLFVERGDGVIRFGGKQWALKAQHLARVDAGGVEFELEVSKESVCMTVEMG